jgi:hypothetical protein
VVLGLVGAALGFAAAPSASRAMGTAAAIWGLVTPFVATLLGAWLACRMASADDARAAGLHGVLVWCIGLVAGAIFLAGTMATGVMSASSAASGNLGATQRQLRADTGASRPSAGAPRAGPESAARAVAARAGGGALAAIAGLLGGICGAAIASRPQGARRGRGLGIGAWRFEREVAERGPATLYGPSPGMPSHGAGMTTGLGEGMPPPKDPYHH